MPEAANGAFYLAQSTSGNFTARKNGRFGQPPIERPQALVYTPQVVFHCGETAQWRSRLVRAPG